MDRQKTTGTKIHVEFSILPPVVPMAYSSHSGQSDTQSSVLTASLLLHERVRQHLVIANIDNEPGRVIQFQYAEFVP